jgi:hypothetical protein
VESGANPELTRNGMGQHRLESDDLLGWETLSFPA